MGLATALMILTGGLMFFGSIRYRTADAPPVASINPKHWTPIWKQKGHFRAPGYGIMLSGIGLMCIGIILRFAFLGWDSWQL